MIGSKIFNPTLIQQFREQFNNGGFGYLRYSNRNGKNDFGAICSAMDWIEVSIDYLINTKITKSRDNIMSMQVFSLIMAVDMICECITTMHRVIFNTSKNEVPFSDRNDVFLQEKSDNLHFKNLRAAFGAHSTDLTKMAPSEKKYSSWSVDKVLGYDYAVFLYSSIPGKKADIYGFQIDDILRFAKIRYEYINILIIELQKQYADIQEQFMNTPIRKSNNLAERISFLIDSAEERFGRSDYYHALIDIEIMLNTPCSYTENEETILEYKQKLLLAIDNIENNMQHMEYEQFPALSIVNPDCPLEISYDIEKAFEAIRQGGWYTQMLPLHLKRVAPYLKRVQCISPELGSDELLLLINAGLYFSYIERAE